MPTVLAGEYWGQTAYGAQRLASDGNEVCSQRWAGLFSDVSALTWCGDSGYGSDCNDGELRLTLLRSPLYLANEFGSVKAFDKQRFHPRSDQGERSFRFAFAAGDAQQRRQMIEAEAMAFHEAPALLPFNPSGEGEPVRPALRLDNPAIQVTAFKKKEDAGSYIIRLYETTEQAGSAVLSVPMLGLTLSCEFKGFEVKTVLLENYTLTELTGLMV
ncbi:MAG: hypothetical protein FWC27_05280 [Firmicutes bacterium]|nr:hypothetical protein [Bacillota bacterium]